MRVKIALASGNIAEKPLITCFKGTNGDYVILDNEANGQMGLPIICVSRLEGTTVNKIVDSTEWTAVKENLKTIIGGTSLPYLPVPENLTASDEFYTQLTLPIASFELLKKTYEDSQQPVQPEPVQEPVAPAAPVQPEPVPVESPISPIDLTPIPEVPAAPVEEIPVAVPEVPVAPVEEIPIAVPEAPVAPVEEIPITVPEAPVAPVEEVPVTPVEEVPVTVAEATQPATQDIPVTMFDMDSSIIPNDATQNTQATVNNMSAQDLKDLKETFMKSCENMFDALVDKFQN